MKIIILAGGGGTRLWPLSTIKKPKQFQKLVSNKTMIEETISRLKFLDKNDIFISINKEQTKILSETLKDFPKKNIIIEPALRDTCACIGLATIKLEKQFPNEVMAVCYADHFIKETEEFQKKLKLAEKIAQKEKTINIIEVEALTPNTNYGYVKIGKETSKDVYELKEFKEKPNLSQAKKFLKSKNYLWNTGYYVYLPQTLLNEYKNLQAKIYKKLIEIQKAIGTKTENKTIESIYPTIEKTSIDFGIMERIKTEKMRIIKAKMNWSDIGNWKEIWEQMKKNKNGIVTRGEVKMLDCQNSLIYADNKKPVLCAGIKDLIIVDTPEGLLICKKEYSGKIKELVNEIYK